mmetsp:Transcript_1943/g.4555  ORF Transcript_1943/g.4555 Transcript_1943/m.4555 type:complete len:85 (-) Transcript_1943:8-262(-)
MAKTTMEPNSQRSIAHMELLQRVLRENLVQVPLFGAFCVWWDALDAHDRAGFVRINLPDTPLAAGVRVSATGVDVRGYAALLPR